MPWAKVNSQTESEKSARFDFDSVADTYDKWYDTAEGAMYDRLEKKALSRYLPQNAQGMKLLEIGCGTGHWSQFFSEHGFEVTGVDVSGRMIEIAENKHIQNASFEIADGQLLPFDDGSFDVTAAITTLEFVNSAELVLHEMVRCTRKPAGRLLIGELNALAGLNRKRQQNPDSLYAKARLFSPGELKRFLERYGQTTITTAAFVPTRMRHMPWSQLIETIGRLLRLPYGAFIAVEVRL